MEISREEASALKLPLELYLYKAARGFKSLGIQHLDFFEELSSMLGLYKKLCIHSGRSHQDFIETLQYVIEREV